MGEQDGPVPGMGEQDGPVPGMGEQDGPVPGMGELAGPGVGLSRSLQLGLLLAVLAMGVTGQESLEPPSNIWITKTGNNFTVTWDWSSFRNEDESDVTFSVFSLKFGRLPGIQWRNVPGCLHIKVQRCDISLNPLLHYSVRVRSEIAGKHSAWSSIVPFLPSSIAKEDSPFAVSVTLIHGRVIVTVSDPSSVNKSLADNEDIIYNLSIWKMNSKEVKTHEFSDPEFEVKNLAPSTPYCLKVQLIDTERSTSGPFSHEKCFETEKSQIVMLRMQAVDTNFTLKWDYNCKEDPNVTFSVLIRRSDTWSVYDGCANISQMECQVLGLNMFGNYDFCVSVDDGQGNRNLSNTLTFKPLHHTVIGPPTRLMLNLTHYTLKMMASDPEGFSKEELRWACNPSYHAVLWKKSSDTQKESFQEKMPFFTVENLEPSTVYCVTMRVVCSYDNRTGLFSEPHCIKTDPDYSAFWKTWGILFILLGLIIISVLVYVCICPFQRYIKYTFYPSGKLPSCIGKDIPDSPFNTTNNVLLLHEEEITDICFITAQEKGVEEFDKYEKISDESCRDSGNYSNEEETTGNTDLCTS
ncbi:interferon alpha beta receptor 1 [Pelobates cultripes]|uniref:Interferon alpha beta receptor 1 n=1 Tax=Pelobates cultripes TaxID=61616 RepID=A0AAD1QX39_PELCU|nr:interferon alpha beta receptor 1 [Pelobates cultripes]